MKIAEKQHNEIEIDLIASAQLLWKKIWVIIFAGLATVLVALIFTYIFITPKYSASVTLYANNSNSNDVSTSITSQDINASVQLVDTYAAIILSDPILDQVIRHNELEGYSSDKLINYIEIESVNNTEVFTVTVEHPDAQLAMDIANSIAVVAPKKIEGIVEGSSVKIVSRAKLPNRISSPNYTMVAILAFIIGIFIGIVVVLASYISNTKIKEEKDLENWDYPVIGNIPSFDGIKK